ncbi:MAG: tetratricopeptide repeat protein [Chthoniobacterales bacterium]
MKIRKFATISLLVLSSFAANSVAPSQAELEAMYDKAFREFDGNNYEQALKDLDAIDARSPDLAESQNLRGVIEMRQKQYANAEGALQKALAADPKFWNARFNLAEIPFLQKNWPEARQRFQELLNSNASELKGEATQLIQYKILITHLMEGKEEMVNALIAKFELAPETPAVNYANAAIALNKKDDAEAKKWLTTAEKSFSPQLNKLFAESLYEVGWLEKPVGQSRAALELNSAAERAQQTKAFAKAKFEDAEQALQQRDLTTARKLIDEADAADANQPSTLNLRGEVLLEQKDFEGAENEFRKAVKADPKFRDAQYNLAQIPFKKKDYAKARERFEQLFATTTGADKDRAAQLIKFKIYLTYLLEGKDARAQKMMEQFQFTGDTPALYYAQAAWEFKHDNAGKGTDWITSARKIYPPALNGVFADTFFDLGWMQSSATEPAAAPVVADAAQPEFAPSIEPTPLPAITLAQNTPARNGDPLTVANEAQSVVPGMGATTSHAAQEPSASSVLATASSPSVETPVASTASPAAARAVNAKPSAADAEGAPATASAAAAASPATVLAPAQVREWSEPGLMDRFSSGALWIGAMGLAGILLLAFTVFPQLRRRSQKIQTGYSRNTPGPAPAFDGAESIGAVEQLVVPTRLAGGPPQVSLQLRASEPALRRAVMPLSKQSVRPNDNGYGNGNGQASENGFGSDYAPVENFVCPAPDSDSEAASSAEGVSEPVAASVAAEELVQSFREPSVWATAEFAQPDVAPPSEETAIAPEPAFLPGPAYNPEPAFVATAVQWEDSVSEPISSSIAAQREEVTTPWAPEEPIAAAATQINPATMVPEMMTSGDEVASVDSTGENEPMVASTESSDEDFEPIGQGQPVPYLTAAPAAEFTAPQTPAPEEHAFPVVAVAGAALAGIGALRKSSVDSPAFAPTIAPEPSAQQPTTPDIMPQPTQPTPAPAIRTAPQSPAAGGPAPQAMPAMQPAASPASSGGMHTAVHLTFSFEIASLQLTPNFKMGSLQLRPTSKVVTMRLAPSQHPQPAMNLQVTFEVSSVQAAGNSLGVVRLTPSQQQRPSITNTPSFNIAGLQLVSGSDAAPVQLTPSQQGQASVLVTAAFQIATVEFSPSFEIASIILNATSRSVNVQLPGTGPSAVEGAPIFEITNVQLGGGGEIGMMQLNPRGAGGPAAKPAA